MCSGVGQCGPIDPNVARCLDDDRRIALDLPCSRCKYNLRSIGLDDACPECGTAVGQSLRPNLLMFAGPRQIRRLQMGAWFLTGVIPLSLLTHSEFYFMMFWFMISEYPGRSMFIGWTAAKLVEKSVAIAGIMCLTITGLPEERPERKFSARRLARWGVVGWLGADARKNCH